MTKIITTSTGSLTATSLPGSITTVTKQGPQLMDLASMVKEPTQISDYSYDRAMRKITLLKIMQEIDNKEVKRLIGLLESPDPENWLVAELCIKQKLS